MLIWLKNQRMVRYRTFQLRCNVDVHEDPKAGMVALVPGLGTNSGSNFTLGNVGIYGPHDELLSVIEVAESGRRPSAAAS